MFLPSTAAHMLAMENFAFDKMKSSRRKQSKPIRVSYSAETEGTTDPNTASVAFPGVKPAPQPMEEDFVNGGVNVGSGSENGQEEESSSPKVNPNSESHHKRENSQLLPKDMESLMEAFPTKYHKLGSELFQGNFVPNGHSENNGESSTENNAKNDNENEESDALSASSKSAVDPNEEGRKLDGSSRIFHQDAYCEICDREFCNKYFLKTHKANKHGIFDNSPSPFSMGALPPSMPLPQDPSPPLSSSMPTSMPTSMPPSMPVPHHNLPPSSSSSFKVMDFIQNLPASEPKTPKLDQQTPNLKSSESGGDSSITSNSATKSGKDMEDFCELCQKHFCNKYYLKKHKQDVHGIAPPDGSSTGKRGGGRSKDLQAQLDAITSSAVAAATSAAASPLIPHSMANMPGLPNMPGVMVLNPFMAPMLIPGGPLMPQSPLPAPRISQPLPVLSSSAMSPESSATPITTTASPSGTNVSDSLRGIGVLNAEAYCELCQKEFCNKYFLKIHKANKHGMFLDEFPFGPPGTPYKLPSSDSTMITSETPVSSSIMENSKDYSKSETSPKPGTSLVSSSANQENYVTYCNLCNQEFASKYTYRIHRIQIHGMLNEGLDGSLTEEIIRNSFRDKERLLEREEAAKISPGSRSAVDDHHGSVDGRMAENGMTTMFGNMVAAKLADRVTCDICNKELCNKYFLKVHKFKVHGIDTSLQDKLDSANKSSKPQLTGDFETIKSGMSYRPERAHQSQPLKSEPKEFLLHSPQLPTSLPLPGLPKASEAPTDLSPNAAVEKPSHEELVKMGIDPEAYCEICKKEFCSKYFLRTHRQNIHGIKSDKAETPDPDKAFLAAIVAANNNNKPLNLSMAGKKAKNGFEKHTWRWKEPVNSSRVSCEICNKELCNKYFLRTHKLNKHGILPSESSLSPSLNNSPTTSDVETSSNSSLPTDLSVHDRSNFSPQAVKLEGNMSRFNSFLNMEDKAKHKSVEGKTKPEDEMSAANRYFNHYSEVCYLCDRRFKTSKWLKAHIIKDHAGMTPTSNMNFDAKRALFNPLYDMNMDQRVCRLCDVLFPSELSMHLHMIQEHNAQVSLNTSNQSPERELPVSRKRFAGYKPKSTLKKRFSFVTKQKLYSCSVCDYKSKWLSNIYSHEKNRHNIVKHESKPSSQIHGQDMVVRSNDRGMKSFRCLTCNRSFPSPILCHHHIREEHIRRKDFKINNKLPNTRLSCTLCHFSTRYSKQLRQHMAHVHANRKHGMTPSILGQNSTDEEHSGINDISNQQGIPYDKDNEENGGEGSLSPCEDGRLPSTCEKQAFQIEDCSSESDFLTSLVKIPVRRHVNAPMTVTFLLTPMEQ